MGDLAAKLRFKQDDQDDWTKVEDKVLRKKIQDRLAKRKSRSKTQPNRRQHRIDVEEPPAPAADSTTPENESTSIGPISLNAIEVPRPASLNASQQLSRFLLSFFTTLARSSLYEFHYLHLSQYNLYRALVANANIMAIDFRDLEQEDCLSPWTVMHPYPSLSRHSLVPTNKQLSTPHHPFIDIMAPPSFRDKVLEAQLPDEEEDNLCWTIHQGGFNVWGENGWDADGWEVSQAFLNRWPQLIAMELIEQSNQWRATRGEGPLRSPVGVRGSVSRVEEVV